MHLAELAIVNPRPSDFSELVAQLRWIDDDTALDGGCWPEGQDAAALQHVASKLAALAKAAPSGLGTLWRQQVALTEAINALPDNDTEEEFDRLGEERRAVELQIMAARPSDLAGVLAQARLLAALAEGPVSGTPQLARRVVEGLEALAGRATLAPMPDGLADLALQARLLADRLQEPRNRELASAIAERLEEMAGRAS